MKKHVFLIGNANLNATSRDIESAQTLLNIAIQQANVKRKFFCCNNGKITVLL